MFDFDLKELYPRTRIFVDSDYPKSFLVYIVNHELKTIVTYRPKYIVDTIELIYSIIGRFNIYSVDLYTKEGIMYSIYKEFSYMANIRYDIYKWRMTLPSEIRNRTYPIYCYEVQGYKFILENEYIKLIEKNEVSHEL